MLDVALLCLTMASLKWLRCNAGQVDSPSLALPVESGVNILQFFSFFLNLYEIFFPSEALALLCFFFFLLKKVSFFLNVLIELDQFPKS